MSSYDLMAVDIGASSGRSIHCRYNGNTMDIREICRIPNAPKLAAGKYYWNVLGLVDFIYHSLDQLDMDVTSIGIDTWGVDFAFLDKNKNLIGNPRSYRDPVYDDENRTAMIELIGSERELFALSGVTALKFNSLCQLYNSMREKEISEESKYFVMMPNLLEFFLSGEIHCEYSAASTTQIYDMKNRQWSNKIIDKLGLDRSIFPHVDYAGVELGKLLPSISKEIGHEELKVVSVAGHDTASAGVAVPSDEEEFAFISSGSMSLFGFQSKKMLNDDSAYRCKVSNEGTRYGAYRPTINMNGLWVINCCKEYWKKSNPEITFDDIMNQAEKAEQHKCFIDTSDYINPGNYPFMIQEFCLKTGQYVPQTIGEIARCVFESLAMEYTAAYESLKKHIKRQNKIFIVGGGAKNRLLNQFTADSLGIPVITGPAEATIIGNILVQLETMGEIRGAMQKKDLIMRSFRSNIFMPKDTEIWEEGFEKYCNIIKGKQ